MDSSVRSTRIRAAGSSMGRLATYTSHFGSGGGDSLGKSRSSVKVAPYRRPSLSIANRLGNPDASQIRRRGFIGGAVWYIVSALRVHTRDDDDFQQGSGRARPQLPASDPARQEGFGGAEERRGTSGLGYRSRFGKGFSGVCEADG